MSWADLVVGSLFGLWVRGRGLRRRCPDRAGFEGRGWCRLPFLGLRLDLGLLRWMEGNLGRWWWRCFGWNVVGWMGRPSLWYVRRGINIFEFAESSGSE